MVERRMQQRRDTAANWASVDPVLASGEVGYETDTGEWKIGDGDTAWTVLGYQPAPADIATLEANKLDVADVDAVVASEVGAGGALDTALSASYVAPAVVMVGPGIDPTGAADSTAAMQAKLDSLPAGGGDVIIPAGQFKITGLTCSKPVSIKGAGGALSDGTTVFPSSARTTLSSTSTNSVALSLTASGNVLEDFAIVNAAPLGVAAGSIGLKQGSGSYLRLNRVSIQGFYDEAHIIQWAYTVTNCHFFDPVRYGVYLYQTDPVLFDNGDCIWQGNYFAMMSRQSTVADAAVRWESGGGIRFVGNKVVGDQHWGGPTAGYFAYGLDFAVADGCSTVELELVGGNISTCSVAGLRITQAGPSNTGIFGRVIVDGVTFQGKGSTATAILINAADYNHRNYVRDIVIDACLFANWDVGVLAKHANNVAIGTNRHTGVTRPVVLGDSTSSTNQSPGSVSVAKQHIGHASTGFIQDNIDIVTDYRGWGGDYAYAESTVYDYERSVRISAVDTPVACFTLEPVPSEGATIDVYVNGRSLNSNFNTYSRKSVTIRQRRALTSPDGGTAGTVTVGTLGADEAIGSGAANVAVLYDTSVSGKVTVKVQTTDATQCSFEGIVTVKAPGSRFKTFRKGA